MTQADAMTQTAAVQDAVAAQDNAAINRQRQAADTAKRRLQNLQRDRRAETATQRVSALLCLLAMLFLVFVGTTPFQEQIMSAGDSQGDVVRQVLIVLILIVLAATMRRAKGHLPFHVPVMVAVTLAYCLMSVSWALDPLIAIRRLALTAIVIAILFEAVSRLGYDRTMAVLRLSLVALLVGNFMVVAFSDYGVHHYVLGEAEDVVGNWRGILPHKNSAGVVCAFTILLFLFDRRRIPLPICIGVIAAAAIFLFFSQSKTSQAMLVLAIVGGLLVRPYSANYRSVLGLLALLLVGVALQLVVVYSDALAVLLSDPGALSGRAQIWPLLIAYSQQYPWTGAGFGSFWQIGANSPIWELTDGWVAEIASHGHNGYLDLVVTIGYPGMLLAVLALLIWPLVRVMLSFSVSKPQRSLLVAMVVFCIGHNLTESTLLDRSSIVQVMLMIAVALIYRLSSADPGQAVRLRKQILGSMRWLRLSGPRSARRVVQRSAQGSAVPQRRGRPF